MSCKDDASVTEISGTVPCGPEPCAAPAPCTSSSFGDCTCGCNPCSCGLGVSPFYSQVPGCQETHVKVCTNLTYSAVVTNGAPFNIPDDQSAVTVKFPGLQKLQVGSFLWSSTYGYFYVVAFDCLTEQAVLETDARLAILPPGTTVPGCTPFNVVDPPYQIPNNCGEGVYVINDFVVPALGLTVPLGVSNVVGLIINRDVQVGADVYLLTFIQTSNLIYVKNNGGVLTAPGTTIDAKDSNDNCIVPITLYEVDMCAAVSASPGSLVICTAAGKVTTLNAMAAGQVPVCVDPTTNTFEAQTVDLPQPVCTFITACLTLMAGTDTYTVVVNDSSAFVIGEVVVIVDPNCDTVYWVITDVPDGTHIIIESIEPQVLDVSCINGVNFCHAPCCEQTRYQLSTICTQDWSAAQNGQVQVTCNPSHEVAIIGSGASFTSETQTINISNPTCNPMQIMLTIDYYMYGLFSVNEDSWARVAMKPFLGYSTATPPAVPPVPGSGGYMLVQLQNLAEDISFGIGPTACQIYNSRKPFQWHETRAWSIPANTDLRVDAYLTFDYAAFQTGQASCCPCADLAGVPTGVVTLDPITVCLQSIAFAVQGA